MIVDIHAHLYDLSPEELDALLVRARDAGVSHVINAATNLETAGTVLAQAREHTELFATAGISPFDTENLPDDWEKKLSALPASEKVIALGEIGLDAGNPRYPGLDLQVPVFLSQLETAKNWNIPAIVHSRGSEDRVIDHCREIGIEKVVFHCFTGSMKALRRLLDSGYMVSFSGIVTFKNGGLEPLVSYAPTDRIFVETDSPYLSPAPFRGKINEPARVRIVAQKVADIKGISFESLSQAIGSNFLKYFGIEVSE